MYTKEYTYSHFHGCYRLRLFQIVYSNNIHAERKSRVGYGITFP